MTALLMLGAGGHARVLLAALAATGQRPVGCAAPEVPSAPWPADIAYIGIDDRIGSYDPAQILLVNGIGSVGATSRRRDIYKRWTDKGYRFANVTHPSAMVSSDVRCGQGVQIMAGAIVQAGVVLEDNVLINTGAVVDHDCCIGSHAHIATGARLSGTVRVGVGAHVGTGAAVVQGTRIGNAAIVGAGAAVVRDVSDDTTVVGNPARVLPRKA